MVLTLGIGAQWFAWRFYMPAILVLLVAGLLAGPGARAVANATGADWLVIELLAPQRTPASVLMPLISIGVALILFEGGLTLRFSEIAATGHIVRNLVTTGALVTWVGALLSAAWIIGLEWGAAVMLGAVLVVTGPTVIGPLLRHIRPSGPVGPILKWEGIVIDPVGVLLALLVFEFLVSGSASQGFHEVALNMVRTLLVGGALGFGAGYGVALLLARGWIPDHLQSPFALMLVVATLALSNSFQHESGVLAVTLMGIALANQKLADVRHILEFKENLRVLVISTLFIVLGARIEIVDLQQLDWRSAAFVAVLILVIRPLAVAASTAGSRLSWRERVFLAWMAPRGIVAAAVSSVFALELRQAGVPGAELILPLTFLVIITTVAVYGLTSGIVAQRLGLADPNPQGALLVGAHGWARRIALSLKEAGLPVMLIDVNADNVAAARLEGLRAVQADVLSDRAIERLELGGIGRVLALTPNDGVNALAAQQFVHEFGRQNVYQLAPAGDGHQRLARRLRGRTLFDESATFEELSRRFAAGMRLRAVPFQDGSGAKELARHFGTDTLPLFLIDARKRLYIQDFDNPLKGQPGMTLIALTPDTPISEPEPDHARAV